MTVPHCMVIVPTYNEAGCIEETVNRLFSMADASNEFKLSVLVFDSHSTDDTKAIVARLQSHCPNLHWHAESRKSGLGSAYYQAMLIAMNKYQPDYLVEFDADGSHDPMYIPSMMASCRDGADAVVGSRYVPGGKLPVDWSWYRVALSKYGNLVAKLFLLSRFEDYTSGFRMTSTKLLSQILDRPFVSPHFAYKIDLFARLIEMNAVIKELPIEFHDREKGYSKLPRNSIVDTLRVLCRIRLRWMTQGVRRLLMGNA